MIVLVRILGRDDRYTLFKVKRILTIIVLYCIINIVKINQCINYALYETFSIEHSGTSKAALGKHLCVN